MKNGTPDLSALVRPAGINASSWMLAGPDHWNRKRLKFLCRVNPTRSSNLQNGTPTTVSFLPMELARENSPHFEATDRPFEEVSIGFTAFADGDVLVAKITPCFENGKGGICSNLTGGIGFGSTEFHVLRPSTHLSAKYLYYVTHSKPFREIGAGQMKGSAGQQRVPTDYLAEFVLPYPPRDEQDEIVAFLDRKLVDIDHFIAKKQQIVALLKEQIASISNHAVWHGLGPDTHRKSSGLDWLEFMPITWEMVPPNWLFSQRNEKARPDDIQLSATQSFGVISQEDFEQKVGRRVVKINQHLEKRKHVEPDDFVISMRSFEGGIERAWTRGAIRSSYVVLKPTPDVVPDYYQYLLKSHRYIMALRRTANFIRDGQDLSFSNFRKVPLPRVPLEEQKAIAEYIVKHTRSCKNSIEKIEVEIRLMDELRTSLIAEALTGKIDVRSGA